MIWSLDVKSKNFLARQEHERIKYSNYKLQVFKLTKDQGHQIVDKRTKKLFKNNFTDFVTASWNLQWTEIILHINAIKQNQVPLFRDPESYSHEV